MGGCCEDGYERLGSIKGIEFHDKLGACWLLKEDSAALSYLIIYYPIYYYLPV